MAMTRLLLSDKYKAFLRCKAKVEVLEGTTYAGKTTVGLFKFVLMVAASGKKMHILSAKDTGTAEKNIISKDLGILDDFGELVEYNGGGTSANKIPHIVLHTNAGDKIIYVLGYGDRTKWQKALGGQYGCLYIDEINTADLDFVHEAAMRCDYMMATLNPDDPELPVYKEYINCCRPLPEWTKDTPGEILNQLSEPEKAGWVHWFFSFSDNLSLTPDKLMQIKENTPAGTKIYKNKILGLRGKATGLVFGNFERGRNTVSRQRLHADVLSGRIRFVRFSAGVDTAYSQMSEDTIAFIFCGITADKKIVILNEQVFNNRDLRIPVAPSDTVLSLISFLDACCREWDTAVQDVFIDSADQATITEAAKYKRAHGCLYRFIGAYKKTKIIDRLNFQIGWIQTGHYIVVDDCTDHLHEIDTYSWSDDKQVPEDGHDHTINAGQYAWLPYIDRIGT